MKNFLADLVLGTSLLSLVFGVGLFFGVAPQYTSGMGIEGLAQFLSIITGLVLFFFYFVLIYEKE